MVVLLISSLSYTVIFLRGEKAIYKKVYCIYCDNADVIKYGKSSGKQRFEAIVVENQKLRQKYLKRQ